MTTLDWNKIATECPKAFKAWQREILLSVEFTEHEVLNRLTLTDYIGNLIMFFDRQNIIATIEYNDTPKEKRMGEWVKEWAVTIFSQPFGGYGAHKYASRAEAWVAAVTESFEILENQLTKPVN